MLPVMVRRGGVAALLTVLTGVAAGCETRSVALTGSTSSEGIVVESVRLEQLASNHCDVHGTIRNESTEGHRVTLDFRALNGRGATIASATATVDFVAAGERANYAARWRDTSDDGFLNDCDRIARVEVVSILT